MRKLNTIFLPLVITILLSVVTTYFLFNWLEGYTLAPSIKNSYSIGQAITIFIPLLIYFFALITLPFLWTDLVHWIKIKDNDWWKALLSFELFSLIISYIITPPDLISTILFFLICQLIVIANSIALKRKLSKIHENNIYKEKNTSSNKK